MNFFFSKTAEPGGFGEEQLRAAARAVRDAMLRSLDEEGAQPHIFSESFLSRMRELLRTDERRARRRRVLQRAAIVLIGFFLAGALLFAFNPDARASVVNWFRTNYENSVLYEFFSHEKEPEDWQTLPELEFTWLPGEYEIQEAVRNEWEVIVLLQGEDDDIIVNYFFLYNEDDIFEVYTESYLPREAVQVNGENADFYQSKNDGDASVLVWSKQNIFLILNSLLSRDDLIRLAEGIEFR